MYLSAFILDQHTPAVRQCLANCHDMHRTIMSGFGQYNSDTPRAEAGILYRLDASCKDIKLFVLSKDMPNWENLQKSGFKAIKNSPKDISETIKSLRVNRIFAFDLLANPSKKKAREGQKNSARIPLNTAEEKEKWLQQKALQNGFKIQWMREEGSVKYLSKQGQGRENATHFGVKFRGQLAVTDEALFQNAFENGVGSGKSYGFGMLMLFPASGA